MTILKKKYKMCPKCEHLNPREGVFCEDCGVNIKEYEQLNPPEPKISGFTALWLILAIIFVFPIGIIGAIFVYYDLNKKKEAWRQERIINKL